jgi:hypothetical protein
LAELAQRYNDAIVHSNNKFLVSNPKLRNGFLFEICQELKDLATREKWHAYFTIDETNHDMCDVQVNYQMDLDIIGSHKFSNWISLWDSMWVHDFDASLKIKGGFEAKNVKIDDDSGVPRKVPLADIYRLQYTVALWRAANDLAKQIIAETFGGKIAEDVHSCLVALVTIVFAAGATKFVQTEASSIKNEFPQHPKTSLCSIFRRILEVTDEMPLKETIAALGAKVDKASDLFQTMKEKLPAYAPEGAPYKDSNPYSVANKDRVNALIDKEIIGRFRSLWRGTFNLDAKLTEENDFGFTNAEPFNVFWAHRTKSKHPPATIYIKGGGSRHIKILFESRYSKNKLNIGFNPFANEKMFAQSYISLATLVAPSKADQVCAGLQEMYGLTYSNDTLLNGVGLLLNQNFKEGPH